MYYSQYEPIILRSLAVIALAVALLFVVVTTVNSGILGGNGSAASESVELLDSAPVAAPAESGADPASTTPTDTRSHVVAADDSFYSIARKYDVTIAEIQQLNPNVDPQNLTPGLRITIP